MKSAIPWKPILIAVIVIGLIAAALSFPLGEPGCQGTDCFNFGANAGNGSQPSAPGPGPTAPQEGIPSVQGTILFPGQLVFADGSHQQLTSQQPFAGQVSSNGKAVDSLSLGVQARLTPMRSFNVSITGWWEETEYRNPSGSDSGFMNVIEHVPVSITQPLVSKVTLSISILGLTRTASALENYSDLSSGRTSTTFTYTLTGALNFTFGAPLSKTVPVVFAWPNISMNAAVSSSAPPPPPGGSGGPGTCPTKYACYAQIVGEPQQRFAYYVLGASPPIALVPNPTSSRDVLSELGLLV